MIARKLFLLPVLALALFFGRATPLAADELDLKDREQVLRHLSENINNDDAILAFYQRVGSWDRMQKLRSLELPPRIWNHLADARTHLVKRLYAEVHAEMFEAHGVWLNDAKKESHFIGTSPSAPKFKGVFSDLDVGMFLDPEIDPKGMRKTLTLPQREVLRIEAKRRMEDKLAKYATDSGHLFDTNLYTTPELFGPADIGPDGVRELDRYDDILAYLAIRTGCGGDDVQWLDLKQRLLNAAKAKDGVEPRVRELVEAAEAKYAEFDAIRKKAVAAAKGAVHPGLADQAVTRHFEDRMVAFVKQHGAQIVAAGPAGQALRTQYNKRKADYEASLRESYFTFAAQTYIVKWNKLSEEQRSAFLADPNKVRRVRADQARFILHYVHHAEGSEDEALRFKLQKIAKYEHRALKAVSDAGGRTSLMAGFSKGEVFELFGILKGKTTPEEAWEVWRAWNFNRLRERDLNTAIPDDEMEKAEEFARFRAGSYIEKHIANKLIEIATDLPSFKD